MIAAISPAAAAAVGTGWERVHAAPMPNEAALLALAARLCESPGQ
jgi:uroporphyrinogen-III synthase